MKRHREREAGQTTVLIIGFVLLALLVTGVMAGATAVYIEHKKLLAVADSAALAAADTFDLAGSDGSTTAPVPVLRNDRVVGVVRGYLDGLGPDAGPNGATIGAGTGTSDGRTAHVELHAVVHPPLLSLVVPDGIPITAIGQARAELRR